MGGSCSSNEKKCYSLMDFSTRDFCCTLFSCALPNCPTGGDWIFRCLQNFGRYNDVRPNTVCRTTASGYCDCIYRNLGDTDRSMFIPADANFIEESVKTAPNFDKYDDKKSS